MITITAPCGGQPCAPSPATPRHAPPRRRHATPRGVGLGGNVVSGFGSLQRPPCGRMDIDYLAMRHKKVAKTCSSGQLSRASTAIKKSRSPTSLPAAVSALPSGSLTLAAAAAAASGSSPSVERRLRRCVCPPANTETETVQFPQVRDTPVGS